MFHGQEGLGKAGKLGQDACAAELNHVSYLAISPCQRVSLSLYVTPGPCP